MNINVVGSVSAGMKKIIKYFYLLPLIILCGCSTATSVQVISNPIRIPANLLTPLPHPIAIDYPYTVNTLLIIISQYEATVDKANDRFEEIIYIQSEEDN